MVLSAPPAHALPVEPRWFDKLVVAIELSAGGVLTLVDHAAPARLREAYLQLRALDPATEVIVDVRRLADLPPGGAAILAFSPSIDGDDLDWLNLNRPVVSDRRLSIVLWCEGDAATVLARRAPDFFDWISARVDCPPAAAAHAVADVKRAICARASGVAWAGDGLEETLAAVRPGRPVRPVAVKSYLSMIDALTSRESGWLVLDGIDDEFHLRRLRWAMAETGRRVIVFRRAFDRTAPGWWTVHAKHVPIADAVHALTAAGGTGRLAALTGLDPASCESAVFVLRQGNDVAMLEEQLAAVSDPRAALHDVMRKSASSIGEAIADDDPGSPIAISRTLESEATRFKRDEDPLVSTLHKQPLTLEQWADLGQKAEAAGDYEVAVRWLTTTLELHPDDASSLTLAPLLALRGQAHGRAGALTSARKDLEEAYALAKTTGDAATIIKVATSLAYVLLNQGEPLRARESLESALSAGTALGDRTEVALALDVLARALQVQGDLTGARLQLERALAMKQRVLATEDHPSIAVTLAMLGSILGAQGDMERARRDLERSLEIEERWWGPDHPRMVVTLRALAVLYWNTDRHWTTENLRPARSLLQRALAIQARIFESENHSEVADTLFMLASVIAAEGDLDAAQAILERALAIRQHIFGDDGQLAGAMTRRALADVLVARGDFAGAIGQLEQALVTLRRNFGRDDHSEIVAALHELERLQQRQDDLQRTD